MLVELGLTPSSRSRIKAAPERPKDELGDFLGEKTG
jgi:phage terminase small subunit